MRNPLAISRFRFMACLMKNVEVCATQTPNGRMASQIGIMLRISFISSTLVTVASLHGFCCFSSAEFCLSSRIAALSRNLKNNDQLIGIKIEYMKLSLKSIHSSKVFFRKVYVVSVFIMLLSFNLWVDGLHDVINGQNSNRNG